MNQVPSLLDAICYLYKGKDTTRKGVCSEEVPVRREPTRQFYNGMRLVQAEINPITNTWLINSNAPPNQCLILWADVILIKFPSKTRWEKNEDRGVWYVAKNSFKPSRKNKEKMPQHIMIIVCLTQYEKNP